MAKKQQLTPTRLRMILVSSLFLIAILGIVGFSFANTQLTQTATSVSHIVVDADASQNSLDTLEKLKTTLANDQDVVSRAGSIVADSQSYQYQDQILTDINSYATQAGIGIANINFGTPSTTSPSTAAPATSVFVPAGVKTTTVTVALDNPVDYDHLLNFFQSIENNLTKMQIAKISISKDATDNDVSSDILTIDVYVR